MSGFNSNLSIVDLHYGQFSNRFLFIVEYILRKISRLLVAINLSSRYKFSISSLHVNEIYSINFIYNKQNIYISEENTGWLAKASEQKNILRLAAAAENKTIYRRPAAPGFESGYR